MMYQYVKPNMHTTGQGTKINFKAMGIEIKTGYISITPEIIKKLRLFQKTVDYRSGGRYIKSLYYGLRSSEYDTGKHPLNIQVPKVILDHIGSKKFLLLLLLCSICNNSWDRKFMLEDTVDKLERKYYFGKRTKSCYKL